MNFSLLKLHPRMVIASLMVLSLAALLSFSLGQLKSWAEIDWLDVVGEGGIVLLTIVWQVFLLISRPPGRVTTLLTIGLCCFMFSTGLDVLDEFIHYTEDAWLPVFESIPAPIGMILMTWGFYQWHLEQLTLNAQLRRREADFREHSEVDQVTRLYKASYMRNYIQQLQVQGNNHFSIALLDIDRFDGFNRCFGHSEGDRLLREVADLIVMNLRQTDLACRYAGDRFIVFMPALPLKQARQHVEQIANAVRYLAFRVPSQTGAIFHTLTTAVLTPQADESVDALLVRANAQLERLKLNPEGRGCEAVCHA